MYSVRYAEGAQLLAGNDKSKTVDHKINYDAESLRIQAVELAKDSDVAVRQNLSKNLSKNHSETCTSTRITLFCFLMFCILSN